MSRKLQNNQFIKGSQLSQRNGLRFSSIDTQTHLPNSFIIKNNTQASSSYRQKLPKFRTQESSPTSRRESSSKTFHFPDLSSQQYSPKIHFDKLNHLKKDVAKTSLFLDSLINILKDKPNTPYRQLRSFTRPTDNNEFLESSKQRRSKRPKIIKNEMTKIFLPQDRNIRKIHTGESGQKINDGLINAIQKISHSTINTNLKIFYNQFLPDQQTQLGKIRSSRLKYKNQ